MLRVLPLIAVFGLAACQSMAADRPARLVAQGNHLEVLRGAIAQMMPTTRVDFGPSDPTRSSRLTVLPPPVGQYETRSLALPVQFDLVIREGKCLVVRVDTQESRDLPPESCVPLHP